MKMRSSPWICSGVLLLLMVLFCAGTRWGRGYPTLLTRSRTLWSQARDMTPEARRVALYEPSYPVLLYLKDSTPPDAVILMPPALWIDERTEFDIPLIASASSVYNFIYPRVPVHYGDPSPWRDRITHILVWDWWGLDRIAPDLPRTEDNRIGVYPWPPGLDPSEVFGPPATDFGGAMRPAGRIRASEAPDSRDLPVPAPRPRAGT